MPISIIETLIDGKPTSLPFDWENNTVTLAFGNDSIEPQVESDRFEMVLDTAQTIINHKEEGNVFEPLPYQQTYQQGDNSFVSLNGYLDMSDGYEELEPTWGDIERPNRVLVKFKQDKSVTNFIDQINGVSYGSLVEEGLISSQDYTTIKTVIVKRTNFLEVATMLLTIYLIQKQIADTVRSIKDTVANVAAIVAAGVTGGVAGAIYATATLLIQVAYAITLIALLVKLVTNLIELILPPLVKNQGIKFRTLLEKSCEKFGYTLVSPIEELDTYYYLPSKPYNNEANVLNDLNPKYVATEIGIPSTSDYGYLINEFWDLMKSMFNTKIAVDGNTIQLRNADDEYWVKQSNFKLKKTVNFPSKTYNTGELKQTRMMTFVTDLNDEYTTENYTGTSYEIKTESTLNSVNNSIKGLDRIGIPLCLPNCKTKPNGIEKIMITLAGFADELSKVIGQNSNFRKQIESNRINVLKVSQNDYGTAKIVPLISNQLPPNHRELLSAKFLMEKYHQGKSFVTGEKLGQKVYYNDFEIPFVLSDLNEVLKNGAFTLPDGRIANFTDLEYNFSKDVATCSIYVNEVYTNKLKEVTFEP
jgi:hypothetical protein